MGDLAHISSPPGSKPNGLQATKDGLWMIDQSEGNKAYLLSYEDGTVLRSFATETDRSSGITYDDGALWIGSTYSRKLFVATAWPARRWKDISHRERE